MYRYDINTSHLLLLFYSFILVILLALCIGVILYAFKKGLKTTTGTQLKFKQLPAAVKFLVCVPLLVAIMLTVLIGRLG